MLQTLDTNARANTQAVKTALTTDHRHALAILPDETTGRRVSVCHTYEFSGLSQCPRITLRLRAFKLHSSDVQISLFDFDTTST